MITTEQLREKINRDVARFMPSSGDIATNVRENLLLLIDNLAVELSYQLGEKAPPHSLIVAYDALDDKIKTSISLQELADWAIANFEPKAVRPVMDSITTGSLGSFRFDGGQTRHRLVEVDPIGNHFYLGGGFNTYNGLPQWSIARFFMDGLPDVTYNNNIALGGVPGNVSYSGPINAKVTPDGKLVVGGLETFPGALSPWFGRLNADGTIDTEFMQAIGKGPYGPYAEGMAVQPDGKILLGGLFWEFNSTPVPAGLVRLLPSGKFDVDFLQNLGTGFNGAVFEIVVQPDGKILVGGAFSTFNGIAVPRMARLNANGTLDTAFTTNLGVGTNGDVRKMIVHPDGRITVGGYFAIFNSLTVDGLVQLNANGTTNTPFMTNWGTGATGSVGIRGIDLQKDGKIIIGGTFTALNGVPVIRYGRLNADGTLDTPYNTAMGTGADTTIVDVALQPNGKALIAGYFGNFNGTIVLGGAVRMLAEVPVPGVIVSPF